MILFGHLDVDQHEFFVFTSGSYNTYGHSCKLLPLSCRADLAKHCFAERVVGVWNQLSAEAADFSSLRRFKAFLDIADYMSRIFLRLMLQFTLVFYYHGLR
jgi:hypothetical protein